MKAHCPALVECIVGEILDRCKMLRCVMVLLIFKVVDVEIIEMVGKHVFLREKYGFPDLGFRETCFPCGGSLGV